MQKIQGTLSTKKVQIAKAHTFKIRKPVIDLALWVEKS
jgi:hypothetical protein